MDQHLAYLDQGAELHESSGNIGGGQVASDPLERLCVLNPDLMLEIAKVPRERIRRNIKPIIHLSQRLKL